MKEIKEELVKPAIDLEKVFFELFAQLQLKPAQCQLIRAFLIASNGKAEFEASYSDLANILNNTKGYNKSNYNNARNALKVLKKWEQKHKITLVEVLETGSQVDDLGKGRKEYKKSKYRFAALSGIAKAYSESSTDLEAIIKFTVEELKKDFVPAKPKNKYHPRTTVQRAEKTVYTKLRVIFNLAIQLKEEPYNFCKSILDECLTILNRLDSVYVTERNRNKLIAEFESQYGLSEINDNQEIDITS